MDTIDRLVRTEGIDRHLWCGRGMSERLMILDITRAFKQSRANAASEEVSVHDVEHKLLEVSEGLGALGARECVCFTVVKLESSSAVERSGCTFIAPKLMVTAGMKLKLLLRIANRLALIASELVGLHVMFLDFFLAFEYSTTHSAFEQVCSNEVSLQ